MIETAAGEPVNNVEARYVLIVLSPFVFLLPMFSSYATANAVVDLILHLLLLDLRFVVVVYLFR